MNIVGIGLRPPHYHDFFQTSVHQFGWVEIHAENFFHDGGIPLDILKKIREKCPVSLHGVGLSLGSADGLHQYHLVKLKNLIDEIDPLFVSEHLSWNRIHNLAVPDLLPLPYTDESLLLFSNNLYKAQDYLKRELFIENPSSYLEYHASTYDEADFLVELCKKSGAFILLDINNLFVSSYNHGWDANVYLQKIPVNLIKELHLAGHSTQLLSNNTEILIDTHDTYVSDSVWSLYKIALSLFGPVPTLIEWDNHIPSFNHLIMEAQKAQSYLNSHINNKSYAHAL